MNTGPFFNTIFNDIGASMVILLILILISWFYIHEIIKSRQNTRKAERSMADERNQLELRVSERTKELIEAERSGMLEQEHVIRLGELSRGLFHDLMSPLSSIALSLEKLADSQKGTKEAEDARELVEKAVAASKRMKSFMDSVRSIIGPEGSRPRERKLSDIKTDLDIALDMLAYPARMKGVTIEKKKINSVLIPIHPVRMQQLLMNMLSNAIESGATLATISVKEEFGDTGDRQVRIEVRDNGEGIKNEHIKHIFKKPFTTKEKGSGLGLMTIRSIVEDELGGSVSLENSAVTNENAGQNTSLPLHNSGAVCTAVIPLSA